MLRKIASKHMETCIGHLFELQSDISAYRGNGFETKLINMMKYKINKKIGSFPFEMFSGLSRF